MLGKEFKTFNTIIVMGLKSRIDRRVLIERQLAKYGLKRDPRVLFIDAICMNDRGPFGKPGSHGAFLTYVEALKLCRSRGGSSLLLQDDCVFNRRLTDKTFKTAYDIFYGGYAASDPSDLYNSDIIGAHCMAYSEGVLNDLIEFLEKSYKFYDRQVNYIAPIDGQIVDFRRGEGDLNVIFDKISFQRPSRSDISVKKLPRPIEWMINRLRPMITLFLYYKS